MSLFDTLESYCQRNNIWLTDFSRYAMRDTTFASRLKAIGEHRIRPGTVQRCVDYIAAHPDGGDCPRKKPRKKADAPRRTVRRSRNIDGRSAMQPYSNVVGRMDVAHIVRVDRDPCWRCETRKDIGCEHFPLESFNNGGDNMLDSAFLRIINKTARSSTGMAETGLIVNRQLGGNQ